MIERLYIKGHFSFRECELNFNNSFIVFSGASGAGKSGLMDTILSLFGYKDIYASSIEATVLKRIKFRMDLDTRRMSQIIFKAINSKTRQILYKSQSVQKGGNIFQEIFLISSSTKGY